MSVGPANSCPCPPDRAPTQARQVVSDLSAEQAPPQSARIRRVAIAPIPLAWDDLVLALESTPSRAKAHEKPQRTKLGAMGEYYRAFVVTEEPVTKWPAKRDEVEYDVLRVSVNVRTN